MRQFNCAAHRLQGMGKTIDSSGNFPFGGIRHVNSYWEFDDKAAFYNPLALLMIGRKTRSVFPSFDLGDHIDLYIAPFNQGFGNKRNYQDCWANWKITNDSGSYNSSVLFNLGRAFLKKFCNITLPYELIEPFDKLFEELP